MMQTGKILVAEEQGSFVLKMIGDVRLTLCTSLDHYLDEMFANPNFNDVVIDLSEAENVDSTTLGQMAKLGIKAKDLYQHIPSIVSTKPSITRVLESMCFDKVFKIKHKLPENDAELKALCDCPPDEAEMKPCILEAHRVLMGLSNENEAKFKELVNELEAS